MYRQPWRNRTIVKSFPEQHSRTITKLTRKRLQDKNKAVNAFVSFTDVLPQHNHDLPLAGVSVAVKDNICTRDLPSTCSSKMLQTFTSPYDATVVRLLRDSGADIVGKTNCDEFGMGSFNVHSVHGPVINPFESATGQDTSGVDERRVAGGSSGGSAAAVAAGMCDVALSTDTGGSTRLPAAYCGIAGLKPSYGLISRHGVVSFADSLDCVGIMAKSAVEIEPVFGTISVYDPNDPTAIDQEIRSEAHKTSEKLFAFLHEDGTKGLRHLRLGIPMEYFPSEVDKSATHSFRNVVQALQQLGVQVVPVSLPTTPYALSAYYVIASAEASSNLARYNGIHYGSRVDPSPGFDKTNVSNIYALSRSQGLGKEVQKRVLLGTYALMAEAFDNYFLQAQRIRQLIKLDFNTVFRYPNVLDNQRTAHSGSGVDALLHLSSISTAPNLQAVTSASELYAYVQDILTVPASLAGLPALSVPAMLGNDGWPMGITVVGQWGHDRLVLKIGEVIQRYTEFL